jgi:hypothetical protein
MQQAQETAERLDLPQRGDIAMAGHYRRYPNITVIIATPRVLGKPE